MEQPKITHLISLASLLLRQGKLAEAEALADRATTTSREFSPGHTWLGKALQVKGEILLARDQRDAARAAFEESLRIFQGVPEPNSQAIARALVSLSEVRLRQGDVTRAEALSRQVQAMLRQARGADHPHTRRAVLWHAQCASRIGLRSEARETLRRQRAELSAVEHRFPVLEILEIEVRLRLGDLDQRSGRHEEATAAWRLAAERAETLLPNSSSMQLRRLCAMALARLGDSSRAAEQLGELFALGLRDPELAAAATLAGIDVPPMNPPKRGGRARGPSPPRSGR